MPRISLMTPTGRFWIEDRDGFLTRSGWGLPEEEADSPLLRIAAQQVAAYFAGDLRRFDLPMQVAGSEFQSQVCAAIAAIPFGETRRYGDLGATLAAPARAVGQACGHNPLPLFIPCHRVMGSRGLGGFSGAGGVETKVALLRHEGAASLLI
ncbi:methylated-DNA--[protein]-cysteine S-methyltransferase [Pseudooceanicola sp. CBS1P-1]|uniref:methylated-DNA--[protein]-cysteine S-methyltransferase n=2 Tax=Paracoccaceae TaxID=31989 RepID=A0A6L7G9D8_9RHOB|nr:methylated-DNA--[protein]-cysteine S-methyltransferase [Pseudooceanicola endophyticus]MXN19313.1 methylated-DNA--[protein]-cysteine S-methyltransferase [Pseudooceanicola albus]